MAKLCLPKPNRDKLGAALKNGELSIQRLYSLASAERQKVLSAYVGDDFASLVNAKFESAMLSKQKNALGEWVKKSLTQQSPIRRDTIRKVEKLEKVLTPDDEVGYLDDLVKDKFGMSITEDEAKTLMTLKTVIDDAKIKVPMDSPRGSQERMEYGLAVRQFRKYVGELKADADSLTATQRLQMRNWGKDLSDLGGLAKSLVATLDVSFVGRQGIKLLLNGNYKLWAKGVKESFKTFGKTLFAKSNGLFKGYDDAALDMIYADIYSRPNAMNGKYSAAKGGYGLGITAEEAFPTSIPQRIPFLGRVFKASESAYNGTALRMRADFADGIIAMAEKNGVDVMDEKTATGLASYVGSMTGRGMLGRGEAIARPLNNVFFSPRFLKANFDTLTAHLFDPQATKETRKLALKSLFRIGTSLGVLFTVSEALNPGSVDADPRKGRFGKIRIGQNDVDITGGLGGLAQFASRLIPTKQEGEWGSWKYSPQTRRWSNMSEPGYGETTMLDYTEQFFEGKLAPLAGVARDWMKNQNFDGREPTIESTIKGLTIPISTQTIMKGLEKGNDHMLTLSIAEIMGLSTTDTDMRGYGKKWEALQEKVSDEEYANVLRDLTEDFNKEAQQLEDSYGWDNMTNDERSKKIDAIRAKLSARALSRYGIK